MLVARNLALSLASCLALVATLGVAQAGDADRISILEENDSLYSSSDKHYTQGLRLSNLGPEIDAQSHWNGVFDLGASVAPIFGGSDPAPTRRASLILGQSIFTPTKLSINPPDPTDRPYGGWLYVGASLLQENHQSMLESLELDVGVVGPGAFGKQVQNNFHQFIGVPRSRGWGDEIQTEPGLMLSYQRLWRIPVVGNATLGLDVVPQAGATVGNVFTYGSAGGTLRIGKNLQADYGQARIRPALSGTDYFDPSHLDGELGYYIFAGVEGRAVGRNIFLDGNSFRQSPSIDKEPLVGDLQAGFSLFWSNKWRIDASTVRRSREFVGQSSPDVIGTAMITFSM